jgi:hypothetical protein
MFKSVEAEMILVWETKKYGKIRELVRQGRVMQIKQLHHYD